MQIYSNTNQYAKCLISIFKQLYLQKNGNDCKTKAYEVYKL